VRGNITFMKEFHSLLKQEAGVRDRIIQNDHELTYRDRDTAAIAHWIYRDMEIITGDGIYLPEKEKIYSQGMNPPPRKLTEKSRQLREKMERAKRMMREGRKLSVIAAEMGYAFQTGLSIAFRRTQGMTPTEFIAASRSENK
ncbi:helix-turn-helix transcriptional regulator, partial [Candidatus Woesearchaeota archaeon]|nr:helix-turn-helix transcriptional regulator [Candidatus Woesearchaeota archaeon]